MHFGFFFSKFFHLISNINLTLPNDMLGIKEEKKKETREVDIRISDQYQMICKRKKIKKKEEEEERKNPSFGSMVDKVEVNLLTI